MGIRHIRRGKLQQGKACRSGRSVSILKPVKGLERDLEPNLESFFRQDHQNLEMIFCLADAHDPALPVIQNLIERYPDVSTRLFVGEGKSGPNPKIRNLQHAYEAAEFDLILISDSNVLVPKDYVSRLLNQFDDSIGVLTSVVVGIGPKGFGSFLERLYLNTFYARWMYLMNLNGFPCVVGKSMMFRRSVAKRFGGIRALGSYLAEDYFAGQAMKFLGFPTRLAVEPVHQPLQSVTLKSFWQRHLRWGRIRKSQAPLAFLIEPFLTPVGSFFLGLLGSHGMRMNPIAFASFHFGLWFGLDMVLCRVSSGKLYRRDIGAWWVRELLHMPLWFHSLFGWTIQWRGNQLKLRRGGLVTEQDVG